MWGRLSRWCEMQSVRGDSTLGTGDRIKGKHRT
jgi:hypothetical protein